MSKRNNINNEYKRNLRRMEFFAVQIVSYLLIGFTVTFMMWLIWPYKILDMPEGDVKLVKNVYEPGSYIEYYVNACKLKSVPGQIVYRLEGGAIFLLGTYDSNAPVGCFENNVSANAYIPKHVPPGEYRLIIDVNYKVNPIRYMRFQNITEPLTVQ